MGAGSASIIGLSVGEESKVLNGKDLTAAGGARSAHKDCTAGGEMKRVIVGISGATGIVYGVRLLEELRTAEVETHLVTSRAGGLTRTYETCYSAQELRAKADVSYANGDVGAAIASGSFRTRGMIIAPCSMRTLAEIATGVTTTLLTRAADVCLKERRRVVLLVRETPLTTIHLRNMLGATEAGAIVFPPVPAFYDRPATVDDIVNHTVGRVLDLFDLDSGLVHRWGESTHPESVHRNGNSV
jgi:4-hydroxy-3-polyprenylbenzoate decarboxylase